MLGAVCGCCRCGTWSAWYLASTLGSSHLPYGQRFTVREAGLGSLWWCWPCAQALAHALNAIELEDGDTLRAGTMRALVAAWGKR